MARKKLYGILILMVVLFASLPLLGNTIFYIEPQDTFFHTQRIWSIKEALEAGQFPVRIHAGEKQGFGYGLSLFYPSLFLYLPAMLCSMGLTLVRSYNLFLILINLMTAGIAFYSFSRIMESKEQGLIAMALYALCTYRLEDMYARGSLGELLALAFVPLCICGLTLLRRGEYSKWYLLAIGFSGVLQSHILSFVLVTVIALLYVLIRNRSFRNRRAILALVKAVLFFLAVNAWFLIPFLGAFGMPMYVHQENTAFWYTDASVMQLFDLLILSANGAEVYDGTYTNSMPKTPGVLLLTGAILLLVQLCTMKRGDDADEKKKSQLGYLLAGLVTTWMTTNLFPWGLIQKIGFLRDFFSSFQFMWRFHIVGTVFLSIAAAWGFYAFFLEEKEDRSKRMVVLPLVICLFSLVYLNEFTKTVGQYGEEEVLSRGTTDALYLLEGTDYLDGREVLSEELTARFGSLREEYLALEVDFEAHPRQQWTIDVPFSYYPDYHAEVDGTPMETTYSELGWVRVIVPANVTQGTLRVYYEDSPLAKAGNVLSLLTIPVFLVWRLLGGRKRLTDRGRRRVPGRA